MTSPHLSDDRLLELALPCGSAGEDAHLSECEECRARHRAVTDILTSVSAAAAANADAAFSAERLAKQHARILQRIELEGRPGRILAFPTATSAPQTLSWRRARPATRWVAGAAAAAFVVGLLAGHLFHDLPRAAARSPQLAQSHPPAPAFRAVTVSDDELFLGQVETAVGRSSPAPLRPLDALTPRAWDVR